MSFSYIAGVIGTDDGTSTPLNVAAGDLLVAWLPWETSTQNPGLNDGGSNVFTTTNIINNTNNDNWGRFAYKVNASANSNALFVLSGTYQEGCRIHVSQFRPDSGETVSLDFVTTGNQGSGSSFASESITSTGNDEVIIVGYKNYDGNTFTSAIIDGDAIDGTISTTWALIGYWLKTATISSKQITATVTNSTWVSMVIGFKSEGASATALPRRALDGPFYGSLRGSVR